MPTQNQANVYAATTHFLRSMAAAGVRDAVAVNKAMRAAPVAWFGEAVTMRGDGRVLHDIPLYRVKAPSEKTGPWDYLAAIGSIPASDAFIPANPACETAS